MAHQNHSVCFFQLGRMGVYTYDEGFTYSYAVYDAGGDLITTDQFPYLKGQGKIVCNEELIGFTIERSNPRELKIAVEENAVLLIFNSNSR